MTVSDVPQCSDCLHYDARWPDRCNQPRNWAVDRALERAEGSQCGPEGRLFSARPVEEAVGEGVGLGEVAVADFDAELEALLVRHGKGVAVLTPDRVLALYLSGVLKCFGSALKARDLHDGRGPAPAEYGDIRGVPGMADGRDYAREEIERWGLDTVDGIVSAIGLGRWRPYYHAPIVDKLKSASAADAGRVDAVLGDVLAEKASYFARPLTDKQRRCLELRVAGWPNADIGRAVGGMSAASARSAAERGGERIAWFARTVARAVLERVRPDDDYSCDVDD